MEFQKGCVSAGARISTRNANSSRGRQHPVMYIAVAVAVAILPKGREDIGLRGRGGGAMLERSEERSVTDEDCRVRGRQKAKDNSNNLLKLPLPEFGQYLDILQAKRGPTCQSETTSPAYFPVRRDGSGRSRDPREPLRGDGRCMGSCLDQ
jgi:hypothetical protein